MDMTEFMTTYHADVIPQLWEYQYPVEPLQALGLNVKDDGRVFNYNGVIYARTIKKAYKKLNHKAVILKPEIIIGTSVKPEALHIEMGGIYFYGTDYKEN